MDLSTIKDRKGKAPIRLTLWKSVFWLLRIRQYGLKKYPDAENYKKVPIVDWTDAAFRHLIAYTQGEKLDKESGLPHLAHALTNICYLIELDCNYPKFNEGDK